MEEYMVYDEYEEEWVNLFDKRTRLTTLPFKNEDIVTCKLIGYDWMTYQSDDHEALVQLLKLNMLESSDGYVSDEDFREWKKDCYRNDISLSRYVPVAYIHILENDCKYKVSDFGFTFYPRKFRVVQKFYQGKAHRGYLEMQII